MSLYRRPSHKLGRRGQANAAAERKVRAKVLERARFRCEACGNSDRDLEWSHLCGRPGSGFCLGPWANSWELTAALCVVRGPGDIGCHTAMDRHLPQAAGFRALLLEEAAKRLTLRLPGGSVDMYEEDWTYPEIIRDLVRRLEDAGVRP